MTQSSLLTLVLAGLALFVIPSMSQPSMAASYDHCIRAGRPQWNGNHFETQLRNACRRPVRVHWCVRKENDRLKCGVNPSLAASSTTTAHANDAKRPVELLIEACEVGGDCRVRRN